MYPLCSRMRVRAAYLVASVAALATTIACTDPATAPRTAPTSAPLAGRSSARRITAVDLGLIGYAYAVAPNGTVVGIAFPTFGAHSQAAIWKDGVSTYLASPDLPGLIEVYALSISPRGEVVGFGQTRTGTSAIVWNDGVPTVLPPSGAGQAQAINPAGDIAGTAAVPGVPGGHAVMWRHGQLVDLGTLPGSYYSSGYGINARGQVVGCSAFPSGTSHAVLWSNGVMTDLGMLPGSSINCATGINERGQVVGWSVSPGDVKHAFLWQDGVMTDLGTLGGANSYATAINDHGQIVGYSDTKAPWYHAFLWEDGVMTDLGTLPGRGDTFSMAYGINDSGRIVGRIGSNWAMWTVH